MNAAIVWNSFVLKSTKWTLFNITLLVSVSFWPYQLTFTNVRDSIIAEDKHNSLYHIFWIKIIRN